MKLIKLLFMNKQMTKFIILNKILTENFEPALKKRNFVKIRAVN